jgi:hypothetical protein
MSDSNTSTGDESDHTQNRRTHFAQRDRHLRRVGRREQRRAANAQRAEEERREQNEASAANFTANAQSQLNTGSSLAQPRGRTSASQLTGSENHGFEPVDHGFGSANLAFPSAHNPIQNIADPDQTSPPTQRGSAASSRRGSDGSTQIGSGVSTRRGSAGSTDTIFMGDGGGHNGDPGGDGQASGSAMASRDANGAEGKKA